MNKIYHDNQRYRMHTISMSVEWVVVITMQILILKNIEKLDIHANIIFSYKNKCHLSYLSDILLSALKLYRFIGILDSKLIHETDTKK